MTVQTDQLFKIKFDCIAGEVHGGRGAEQDKTNLDP